MIAVAPFDPLDLCALAVQPGQRELLSEDRYARGQALASTGRCFTIRAAAGTRVDVRRCDRDA